MGTPTLSYAGRLPGVGCAPALPPAPEPVRLDVAAFVGFAASGPLNRPVAVEDVPQFEALYGADVPLCVDEAGVPQYAHLASAVRAFFGNGGRRAHVVRVAGGSARATRWTLPGVATWHRSPGGTQVRPARIESAWPGSASAYLSVDTAVTALPLAAAGGYERPAGAVAAGSPARVAVRRVAESGVRTGDLLRLDLVADPDAGASSYPSVLLVRVATVRDGVLEFDAEFPAEPATPGAGAGTGFVPAPGYEPGVAATLPVGRAVLLRFEIAVHGHRPGEPAEVHRFRELSFGTWAAALHPAADAPADIAHLGGPGGAPVRADAVTSGDVALGLTVPVPGAPQAPRPAPADQVGRDGLDTFDPAVFVDPRFAGSTVTGLPTDLEAVALDASAAHPAGLHALYAVDEVAMVAAPDAGHRGWAPPPPPAAPEAAAPEPPAAPVDWSDFRACADHPAGPDRPAPPDPAPAPPPEPTLPLQHPAAGYDASGLVAVQRALITMCAARADAVALLSTPRHLDPADVPAWLATLMNDPALTDRGSIGAPVLSHAAGYYPWLSVPEPVTPGLARLRVVPPEGAVAGTIAAREAGAGPWAAPARVPLRGVVQVRPELDHATALRLLDAHANLVLPLPGRFVAISAHTLTADPQSRQLSVRRLLIYLRKVADRLGRRYVFEPNGEQLRTTIRLRFAGLLEHLVAREAIRAFTVRVDGSGAADGELVVALQIAPYEPVEFITVTLVRSGEGLFTVLEG